MQINPKTKDAYNLLHSGTLAFARAERQGIRINLDYVQRKQKHLTKKITRLKQALHKTKFYRHWEHVSRNKPNIMSNAQLAHLLYKVKKLEPAYTTESGQGATDEEALKQLHIPELNDILRIRKLRKVRDTYLKSFEREIVRGYIHPSFNLHLVKSYRSSSDHPNFQNVPKRDEEAMQTVRRAMYPRPGHQLMEVDYSGLETKIISCYSQDPNLLKYMRNAKSDMHADMARRLFKLPKLDRSIPVHNTLRAAAKNGFVFPQFYGDYYKNCAVNLACNWGELPDGRWKRGQGLEMEEGNLSDHLIDNGMKSLNQFTKHVQAVEEDFKQNRFPDHFRWDRKWWKTYKKYGYLDMKTEFRCVDLLNHNRVINRPIQGAAFHCLLWSFIQLDKIIQKEQWNTRLIGQIHDSIILDCHPQELSHVITTVKQVMTEKLRKAWDWIIVPLEVDVDIYPVDGSWAEKEAI